MNESVEISRIYSACSAVLDNWVFRLVFLLGAIFVGILLISRIARLYKDADIFVRFLYDNDGEQYRLFKDGHVELVALDDAL